MPPQGSWAAPAACLPASAYRDLCIVPRLYAKARTCRSRVCHRQKVVPPPLHTPAQQVAPPRHPRAAVGQASQEALQLGVGVGVGVGKLVGLMGPAGRYKKTAPKQRHVRPRAQGAVQQTGLHHIMSGCFGLQEVLCKPFAFSLLFPLPNIQPS